MTVNNNGSGANGTDASDISQLVTKGARRRFAKLVQA
jgi:hypothetical protein